MQQEVIHKPWILLWALFFPDPTSTISEHDMVSLNPRMKSWIALGSVKIPLRAHCSPKPLAFKYIFIMIFGVLTLGRFDFRYEWIAA